MIEKLDRSILELVFIFNIFLKGVEPRIFNILLWTSRLLQPFKLLDLGQKSFIDRKCTYTNCYITDNASYLTDVTRFDVILFNSAELWLNPSINLPAKRARRQKYVFVSTESAANYPITEKFNGFFNWTWTYKLDSDISWPVFLIKNGLGDIVGPRKDLEWIQESRMRPIWSYFVNLLQSKTKAAVWVVPNCKKSRKAMEYVDELNQELEEDGLTIDIYGCDDHTCIQNSCERLIKLDYYFYLAFEDSFAEDYVTDTLLKAIKHHSVPIVMGGADYRRFMPRGMYLDASRLNARQLAKRMVEILQDREKYRNMFRWKRYYSYHSPYESPLTDPICLFCALLNDEKSRRRITIYRNIVKWFNNPESLSKHTNNTRVGKDYYKARISSISKNKNLSKMRQTCEDAKSCLKYFGGGILDLAKIVLPIDRIDRIFKLERIRKLF